MGTLMLHDEVFREFFRPYRHPEASGATGNRLMLAPYGADAVLVRRLDRNHVWTMVDDGSGRPGALRIVPGLRLQDRVGHFVTELPHDGAAVAFVVRGSGPGLGDRTRALELGILQSQFAA